MRYFKIEKDGELLAIGTCEIIDNNKIEITEEEYNIEYQKIQEKGKYLNQLLNGEITADDIPEEFREDVIALYEQMTAEPENAEVTEEDYINALESLGVSFNG